MESIGVLMECPVNAYLEDELSRRYKLFSLWKFADKQQFLAEKANSIHAVVGRPSAELIDALTEVEIIAGCGIEVDKIVLQKCKERGITVTNTPDLLTDDIADLALGLMIGVLRRIPRCDRYVRSGSWKKGEFNLSPKFTGKRVGVIGLGKIGAAVARRAEAFDCQISYHTRTRKPDSSYKYYPSVVDLASNCDILVIACLLTEETRHTVSREVIDALGPRGVLINIARSHHVDEPELASALVEGRLGGAALEVFEHEPHLREKLFNLDNVVLLPRAASATFETHKAMAGLVLRNLEAHFLGKPLLTPTP